MFKQKVLSKSGVMQNSQVRDAGPHALEEQAMTIICITTIKLLSASAVCFTMLLAGTVSSKADVQLERGSHGSYRVVDV